MAGTPSTVRNLVQRLLIKLRLARTAASLGREKFLLISYDVSDGGTEVTRKAGDAIRAALVQFIQLDKNWEHWHILESVWILKTKLDPNSVFQYLWKQGLREGKDGLIVTETSPDTEDWGLYTEDNTFQAPGN